MDDRGEQLALVRQRLRLDEPGELERLRARQAATRAAIAQARENADNAARALALLLGRDGPDPAWRAYRTPPTLGAFTLQQVPADLLRHRPQILLAESEVMQAAASRVRRAQRCIHGSALAAPSCTRTLTQNARSNSDSSPSIGPYIDIPLWDWGQRRARFHADEQLDAALLGYRKAVLEGISEVEGALGSLARQDSSIQSLRAANDAANQQVKRQARQVQLGLSSEFDGLDTQRAALASQADLIGAQGARVLAFASLTAPSAVPRCLPRVRATTMIALARKTLAYEWRRFLPVVLAMCFAGVLLIVQAALVLGIFGTAAIYVKASSADIWAGFPGTQSVNYGHAISADVESHLRMDPMSPASSPTSGSMANGDPARRAPAMCRCTCPVSPPGTMR